MRVLIIGVNHALQVLRRMVMSSAVPPEAEQQDKERFVRLLRESIDRLGASLIGEEFIHKADSIPKRVATDCGIRHEIVEMTFSERSRRKIPHRYSNDPNLSQDQIRAFHSQREQFMACRIDEVSVGLDAIVVVCGSEHVSGLTVLLSRNGHLVEQHDVLTDPQFDLRWIPKD